MRVQPDESITFKLLRSETLLYTFRASFTVTMAFLVILMYAFVLDFRESIVQDQPAYQPLGQEYMAKPSEAELARRDSVRQEMMSDDDMLAQRERPLGTLRDDGRDSFSTLLQKFMAGDRGAQKTVYSLVGGGGAMFFGFLTTFLWILLERKKKW